MSDMNKRVSDLKTVAGMFEHSVKALLWALALFLLTLLVMVILQVMPAGFFLALFIGYCGYVYGPRAQRRMEPALREIRLALPSPRFKITEVASDKVKNLPPATPEPTYQPSEWEPAPMPELPVREEAGAEDEDPLERFRQFAATQVGVDSTSSEVSVPKEVVHMPLSTAQSSLSDQPIVSTGTVGVVDMQGLEEVERRNQEIIVLFRTGSDPKRIGERYGLTQAEVYSIIRKAL